MACNTSSSRCQVNYNDVCNWILRMLNSKQNTNCCLAVCLEHLNLMYFDIEGNPFFESFLQAKKPGATTRNLSQKRPPCSGVILHSKNSRTNQIISWKSILTLYFIPRSHCLFISRIQVSPTLGNRTENQERNYTQLRRNLQKTVK